jgi:hypothetical protein
MYCACTYSFEPGHIFLPTLLSFHVPPLTCSSCRLPDDIWLVDLDSNKITPPSGSTEELPSLPEPEGTILKNHLKQVSPDRKTV